MRILRFWPVVMAAWLIGCEMPPDYSYKGELVRADGAPAAGVPVVVAPASSIFRGIPEAAKQVTTDADGKFSGDFANDMDGDDWARLPLPAMPPLAGVYVWVQEDSGWRPIPVSLDMLNQQKQHAVGEQQISLPTVRLRRTADVSIERSFATKPAMTHPAMTQPAVTKP